NGTTSGQHTTQSIHGDVYVTNPNHHSALNVDNAADGSAHPNVLLKTVTVAGDPLPFPYGRISNLAPGSIFYRYLDTSTVPVRTGTGGNTVNVLATGVETHLVGNSSGTVVNLGDDGGTPQSPHSLQGILADVFVTNPPSFTTLHVDDRLD